MTLFVDLTGQMVAGEMPASDFQTIFGISQDEVSQILPTIPDGLKVAVDRIGDSFLVAIAHQDEIQPIGRHPIFPETRPKGVGRSTDLGEAVKLALKDYAK